MARRNAAEKREVLPDPKYGSEKLSMFINVLMKDGKKSIAEKVVYKALEEAGLKANKAKGNIDDDDSEGSSSSSGQMSDALKQSLLDFFYDTLQKVTPNVEVRSRRVGGATYQVPVEVASHRQMSLAIRWLLMATRSRGGRSMAEEVAAELMDAANGQGAAVKRKDDTHRMAEANRAFAHYRF